MLDPRLAPVSSGSGLENRPTVLDLFSAPGGMSQGFRDAGFKVLAVVDIDSWGCETLRQNFSLSGTEIIETDVQRLGITGRVDVVTGGPPCQSFSQVGRAKINHLTNQGKRERFIDDERNRMYKEFVRVVASLKPQFFVMENVPGISSFRDGQVVEDILADFEGIGYSVDVEVLKAADYGIPQIRRRAIFIGNRLGERNLFPAKIFASDSDPSQSSLSENLRKRGYLTIYDAISDLPSLQAGEGEDEVAYSSSPLTKYQEWARQESDCIYNHVARKHSDRDIQLFRALTPGQQMTDLPDHLIRLLPYPQDIFKDKIKKHRWDQPSYAIVAHMQKDGLMYIHPDPEQPRSFTPREAARIQSFRDSFRLMGPLTQQFRQVGNAVPPLLARSIAEMVRKSIDPGKHPRVRHAVVDSGVKPAVLIN